MEVLWPPVKQVNRQYLHAGQPGYHQYQQARMEYVNDLLNASKLKK